jgi:hypothetical protein
MNKPRRKTLLAAGGALMLIGAVISVRLLLLRPEASGESARRPANAPTADIDRARVIPRDGPSPPRIAGPYPRDADRVRRQDLGTTLELALKGFPPMMPFRRLILEQTEAQSRAEVAADMANQLFTMMASQMAGFTNNIIDMRELRYYHDTITPNIKVMRLIEEGRRDPEDVLALLSREIQACIDEYGQARERWRIWSASLQPSFGTSRMDAYYAEHRRYEDPWTEFTRIHDMANSALYVLANIDRLSPELLAAWVGMDRQAGFRSLDMDVWFVDRYFQQSDSESQAARNHWIVRGGRTISGATVRLSTWDAPYDTRQPLLALRGVNLSGMRTIEVLDIPLTLPEDLDARRKEAMLRNFVESFGR